MILAAFGDGITTYNVFSAAVAVIAPELILDARHHQLCYTTTLLLGADHPAIASHTQA